MAGFEGGVDDIDLDVELREFLVRDKKGKKAERKKEKEKADNVVVQASHVNQWRFRSALNETYNLEYFYNHGTLTGNELL